jgi:hypothetical protein
MTIVPVRCNPRNREQPAVAGKDENNAGILHSSLKVTERHYAPWVRSRQEQLEADVRRTWETDPSVPAETKGTQEVHTTKHVVQ